MNFRQYPVNLQSLTLNYCTHYIRCIIMNFCALFALNIGGNFFISNFSHVRQLYFTSYHSSVFIADDSRNHSSRGPFLLSSTSFLTRSFLPPIFVRCHRELAASGISRGLHQLGLTGFTISHQHWYGDPPGRTSAATGLNALARRSLRLVPVILEPDLHLGRRETNDGGQMLALGCT